MNSLFLATQKELENDIQETNLALKAQASSLAALSKTRALKRTKGEPAKLSGRTNNGDTQ